MEQSRFFGAFELDSRPLHLYRESVRVPLRRSHLRLLELLVVNAGSAVSRETIHGELWLQPDTCDRDPQINRAVARLRSALGDDARAPRFIETLPCYGYRFVAPVSVAAKRARPVGPAGRRRQAYRPAVVASFAILAAVLASAAIRSADSHPASLRLEIGEMCSASDRHSGVAAQLSDRLIEALLSRDSEMEVVYAGDNPFRLEGARSSHRVLGHLSVEPTGGYHLELAVVPVGSAEDVRSHSWTLDPEQLGSWPSTAARYLADAVGAGGGPRRAPRAAARGRLTGR